LENGIIKEAPLRRQLRSSQSFHTQTADSDSAGSNLDTPSEIPTKEVEETPKDVSPEAVNEPIISSQASGRSTGSRQSLPNMKGKDLFDSIIWTDKLTTSIFYTFISSLRKKIYNDVTSTTDTHKFIRALRDGGRLVRNYTQNIDMLEERETLCTELERGPGTRGRFNPKLRKEAGKQDSGVEVVHLHGSLEFLRCGLCAQRATWDDDRQVTTLAGDAPECPSCSENSAKREGKGRRSLAVGRLRPDIVLYGEEHPSADLVGPIITHDLSLGPDILLILGTSMRVHGLKVMVREFAKAVHGRGGSVVFVNQTKPPDSIWGEVIDYWVEWDCDAWVADLRQRKGDIFLAQGAKPKDEPSAPPKNPSAMRPDLTNGAYLQWKILSSLRQLTGRGKDEEAAKIIKRIDGLYKQTDPKSTVQRRPSLPATTKKQKSRIPLSNLSSNVQGPVMLPANGKPKSTSGQRRALPSPPTSDEAGPLLPQPMTPRAERIKKLTSIDAILSSPLSSPPKVIVWADYQ
jgi:NAD-dependent SIR2 family protein deacetylase